MMKKTICIILSLSFFAGNLFSEQINAMSLEDIDMALYKKQQKALSDIDRIMKTLQKKRNCILKVRDKKSYEKCDFKLMTQEDIKENLVLKNESP